MFEPMEKKVIAGVVCMFLFLGCYIIERNVYQQQTYGYYKECMMQEEAREEQNTSLTNLQKKVVKENQIEKKVAYLTFDDGPSDVTETVLKVLDQNQIKATFFLIGESITSEKEDLVKKMVKEGHVVGIHTYSHRQKEMYASKEGYLNDFKKAANRIYEITGEQPKIFRFPWGSANNYLTKIGGNTLIEELENDGYTYFDWNVSAEDSVGKPTAQSIIRNIKKDYKKYKEPVLLMHDANSNRLTAKMLPRIIEMLKESGYSFDTLDHMKEPVQYPRD